MSARGPEKKNSHQYASVCERWALVVGVSHYQYDHDGIRSLAYPDRDAQEFAQKLKSPLCGSFPEKNVKLLTNASATLLEVQKGLRSFLAQPKENDLVIIYFSGHGAPDPVRPTNFYLLTHDTHPNDIAGTALPMREIQICIQETLQSRWVVVIADACHSGALTMARSSGSSSERLNTFMSSLQENKRSLAWLTSSRANQLSFEDHQLGNGVFTYHLLRGMEGKADGYLSGSDKDGLVTISELFNYVSDEVTKFSKGAQSPTPGPGDFDEHLPISFSGQMQAQDYFEVAQHTMHLGEILLDPERFKAAADYFEKSNNIAHKHQNYYQAIILSAKCLAAQQAYKQAVACLEQLLKDQEMPPVVHEEALYLATLFCLMEPAEHKKAHIFYEQLSEQFPIGERGMVLKDILPLHQHEGPKLWMVLVGINEYPQEQLKGCLNDVEAIKEAMVKKWGSHHKIKTTQLLANHASKAAIKNSIQDIVAQIKPLDSFFFHFSGAGGSTDSPIDRPDLIIHCAGFDAKANPIDLDGAFSAKEFHELIKSLPNVNKIVSIDTHSCLELVDLVEAEPDYSLFYAASPGQNSFEIKKQGKHYGIFSNALVEALGNATPGDFEFSVQDSIQANLTGKLKDKRQHPLMLGTPGNLLGQNTYTLSDLLQLVFSPAIYLGADKVYMLEKYFCNVSGFYELHLRLFKAYLQQKQFDKACMALSRLSREDNCSAAILPLSIYTHYHSRNHGEALKLLNTFSSPFVGDQITKDYDKQLGYSPQALLIAVDDGRFNHHSNAVKELDKVLNHRFPGIQSTLLTNDHAKMIDIQAAIKVLQQHPGPSLFYYVGTGKYSYPAVSTSEEFSSTGKNPIPSIKVFDNWIRLDDLKKTCSGEIAEQLVCIFDLSFITGLEEKQTNQFEPNHPTLIDDGADWAQIGACSVYPGVIRDNYGWKQCSANNKQGGIFTQLLSQAIEALACENKPYSVKKLVQWIKNKNIIYGGAEQEFLLPRAFGDDRQLFLYPDPKIDEDMKVVMSSTLCQAEEILSRFKDDPNTVVELAYVKHLLGKSDEAIQNLESLEDKTLKHYPLGRIYVDYYSTLQHQNDKSDKDLLSAAIHELQEAKKHLPYPILNYYLGKAILELYKAETTDEVEELFQDYAQTGFQNGNQQEVEAFLTDQEPQKRIYRLLQAAKIKEKNQDFEGALQLFQKASAEGNIEAVEEQVRIYMNREEWMNAFLLAYPLMNQGNASELIQQQLANIIPQLLGSPALFQHAEALISNSFLVKNSKGASKARLKNWLTAYQVFQEKTKEMLDALDELEENQRKIVR